MRNSIVNTKIHVELRLEYDVFYRRIEQNYYNRHIAYLIERVISYSKYIIINDIVVIIMHNSRGMPYKTET